jgi:hypothetical protein
VKSSPNTLKPTPEQADNSAHQVSYPSAVSCEPHLRDTSRGKFRKRAKRQLASLRGTLAPRAHTVFVSGSGWAAIETLEQTEVVALESESLQKSAQPSDSGEAQRNFGWICLGPKNFNFSTSFADRAVGIKQVHDDIWLVSFMDYDLRDFDLRTVCSNLSTTPSSQVVNYVAGTFRCLRLRAAPRRMKKCAE